MTESEKLALLQILIGSEDEIPETVLTAYLLLAANRILRRAFPCGGAPEAFPAQYDTLQCEIAAYLYNRRGDEGQLSHGENGINRTYESADVPESMLRAVIPFVGVIGR